MEGCAAPDRECTGEVWAGARCTRLVAGRHTRPGGRGQSLQTRESDKGTHSVNRFVHSWEHALPATPRCRCAAHFSPLLTSPPAHPTPQPRTTGWTCRTLAAPAPAPHAVAACWRARSTRQGQQQPAMRARVPTCWQQERSSQGAGLQGRPAAPCVRERSCALHMLSTCVGQRRLLAC